MKKILVILILCPVHLIFAQSKKHQIEQLQFTTDSLNRVIDFDRNTNKQKLQELNSAIVNFETKILNQGRSIDSLNSVNRSLNNQLNLKSKELDRLNESNTSNEKKIKTLEETNAMIQLRVSQMEKEKQNKVDCEEREEPNADDIEFPKLIRTCTFRDFKIRSEGVADYNGRYSYDYEYFKNNQAINPSEIFNSKIIELESMLNKKFKAKFLTLSKDPDSEICFDDITYENVTINGEMMDNYRLNAIDISFENNSIIFSRSFELLRACLWVDGAYLKFSIAELEPYLAE